MSSLRVWRVLHVTRWHGFSASFGYVSFWLSLLLNFSTPLVIAGEHGSELRSAPLCRGCFLLRCHVELQAISLARPLRTLHAARPHVQAEDTKTRRCVDTLLV